MIRPVEDGARRQGPDRAPLRASTDSSSSDSPSDVGRLRLTAGAAALDPPRLSWRTTALAATDLARLAAGAISSTAGATNGAGTSWGAPGPVDAGAPVPHRAGPGGRTGLGLAGAAPVPHRAGPGGRSGLIDLLAGRDDVCSWVRDGQGLVGFGRILELDAQGEGRIDELRSAWRAVVYASWWSDPLVRPGTGPVALGTITFSPDSAERSVLVVPAVLIGVDQEGAWATTAVLAGQEHPGPQALIDELLTAGRASSSPVGLPHRAPARRRAPESAAGESSARAQRPGAAARGATGSPAQAPPSGCAPGSGASPREAGSARVGAGALSARQWCGAVKRTQERMRSGEAAKVVLARDALVSPDEPMRTGDLLRRLAVAYPSCWTFAVDSMVGASPELLVRLEGRRLFSRVLAGTARRRVGATTEQDAALATWLEGSEKNNREHALARASALEALEPLCSVVEAPPRFVLELPNVLHLASDITGVVAGDTGALSLVGALHPTAAVCGTPTTAAARIIAEVEGMDRGRYAGPVGWVDWHGEGEWCIALRSARLPAGGVGPGAPARVFGGGGIMPDSDPADELAETRVKMLPMLQALGATAPSPALPPPLPPALQPPLQQNPHSTTSMDGVL